ncbi:MAG: hypothetical protein J0H65_15910 [Rhizobiales bacterium]|nr:hypothetical protein [Hyphomicrobiales bacterium]
MNAFGVVSAASVVTLHASVTPPTFTVAVMAVEKEALEVRRTASVCPLVILPDVPQAPPAMEICAPVPVTETGVVVLMPVMVTALAVVSVLRAAFVKFGVKSNATGALGQMQKLIQHMQIAMQDRREITRLIKKGVLAPASTKQRG